MKKILVVDNDRTFLVLMERLLTRHGYGVVTADGGMKALDVLKSYVPDVIFLDLVMPHIDGQTLCRIIRSFDTLKNVPIVILSGVPLEDLAGVSQLQVNACIAKGPFNETAPHVLGVLNRSDLAYYRFEPPQVLGADRVSPRVITRELLSIKRHFERILQKMSEGIVEIGSDGRIVFANAAAAALAQMPEEAMLGFVLTDLVAATDRSRVADLTGPEKKRTAPITARSPVKINDRLVTIEVLRPDTPASTAVMIIRDVTERKQAEAALEKKVAAYEQLLPVCCVCKKIRDDAGTEPGSGEWMSVEKYLWTRKGIASTSTYCSVCQKKIMQDIESEDTPAGHHGSGEKL